MHKLEDRSLVVLFLICVSCDLEVALCEHSCLWEQVGIPLETSQPSGSTIFNFSCIISLHHSTSLSWWVLFLTTHITETES